MEGGFRPDKKVVFVVGVCSGVLLSANWRTVLKFSTKTAMRGVGRVQRLAVKSAENISDVAHQARSELHAPPTRE